MKAAKSLKLRRPEPQVLRRGSRNPSHVSRFLRDVEEAQQAAFGGEGVDVGEELLEAVEVFFAFESGEGAATFLAGVAPA